MQATALSTALPLRIGSRAEFACVSEFLRQSGFESVSLCRRLGMKDMSDLGRVAWEKIPFDTLAAPLNWCIQIFLRGLPASAAESQKICGPEVQAAFVSLGLLRPAKKNPDAMVCPVWLYPVDGFVMVSDRRDDPDGDAFDPGADVVFPAIYAGTLRFLQFLPDARGGEALDLCGGSGVGALRLSKTARVALTADLTERSAFFAEFNARLNRTEVGSLCGDLYAPVHGRQFDVISAHPPFVPATGPNMVYRDGGETGEEVVRRTIEGLPAHLRAGGTFVMLCVARDSHEKTFEQRAREWLGTAGSEFDVVFGLEKVLSVGEVVESMRKRGQHIGEGEAQELHTRLNSAGTRQFVYGVLCARRADARVPQDPLRINLTPAGRAADFERLLAWRHHVRQPGFAAWLASSKPRLAAPLELTVRHAVQDGELTPVEFVFSAEQGFHTALRPDGWVVPLAARLEGKRTVREVFAAAEAADELPAGFTLEAFTDLVRLMIELGLLEVDFPR